MSILGAFHLSVSIAAIALGAMIFLVVPKGTRRHRQLGWAYVACMVALNVSALSIYRLFGGFGPFHVFAVVSLATIVIGTATAVATRRARQRRDLPARARWSDHHYHWMAYAYVGLLAAAASEVLTRLPATRQGPAFGIAVAGASIAVFIVGSILVRRRMAATLAPFRVPVQ
jgi:uncharacterized membrane protein